MTETNIMKGQTGRSAAHKSRIDRLSLLSQKDRLCLKNRLNLFGTGINALDDLFPDGGIPYGQLIEITGGRSSGKTSLLFRILARLSESITIAYVDLSRSFFPVAALSAGIDANRLLIVKPKSMLAGLRTAEEIFRHKIVGAIVFDLTDSKQPLPFNLLHRLRQQTNRSKGLVIFLTDNGSEVIPASMVALRLKVNRKAIGISEITVTKSRICKEGARVELPLGGGSSFDA